MKIGIEWNSTSASHPIGVRVRVNPRCTTRLADDSRCGLPATVRVTHGSAWSLFWCPIHSNFDSGRDAWDRYWRLFPNAIDRSFIDWMAAHG